MSYKLSSCNLNSSVDFCSGPQQYVCYLDLSFSGGCSVIDDVITANDDKESCEDRTSENITTVVNKHLSHVAALKQVRHDESLHMRRQ